MSSTILLETIKISDAEVSNLFYHQERCTKSRKKLFGSKDTLSLGSFINPPSLGTWRCRVLYAQNIKSIEYIPYIEKAIHTLKIIPSSLEYSHKYANRDALTALVASQDEYDDILIEKEGYITDTSIANIAFYDGEQWFTPSKPLLEGTMRANLLDKGFLKTTNIRKEELACYTQVALMNAMIGFKVIKDIKIQDFKGYTYDY